jgi:hypothetical protein
MLKVPDTTPAHDFIMGNSKLATVDALPGETTDEGEIIGARAATSTRTVLQSSYLDYMESIHQLPPTMVKAVASAQRDFTSGAVTVATADLVAAIERAKAAGEDPSNLSAVIKVARPDGQLRVGVNAQGSVSNPKTGERSTQYGVVTVRTRTAALTDDAVVQHTHDIIKGLMGS